MPPRFFYNSACFDACRNSNTRIMKATQEESSRFYGFGLLLLDASGLTILPIVTTEGETLDRQHPENLLAEAAYVQ